MNVKPIKHLLPRKGNVCHFRLCISSQRSKGSEDQLPLLLCCLKKSLIIPRMYGLQQKKHKLLPVPSGLSLFLCEYCFLFALSPVPSAYQTQSTNTRWAQWDWGDEAQDVNPPALIHSASLTQVPQTLCVLQKVKNPIPAGSLKVIATSFTSWAWCMSYLTPLETASRQKGQLLSGISDTQQQS